MTDLEGVIDRITFQNEENGYTVARFQTADENLTVVGFLPNVSTGENLRLTGDWIIHPTYGRQFKVEAFEVLPPMTLQGIERYLGSGLIKGIGPVTAKKMVQAFGLETLKIIDETPERLMEIEGIGPQKAAKIAKALEEQRQIRRMMVFLRGVGITPVLATKIYRRYGEQAAAIIKENPYRLADELFGVGFKTADRIAALLGRKDPAALERVRAGILHYLGKKTEEGHVYVPKDEFAAVVSKELAAPVETVDRAIKGLVQEKELYLEEGRLYLAVFYWCERRVAEKLRLLLQEQLVEQPVLFTAEELKALTFEQRLAVEKAFQVGVLLITGGPGTGKTTTIRSLIRLCRLRGEKAMLAAPTGRAA